MMNKLFHIESVKTLPDVLYGVRQGCIMGAALICIAVDRGEHVAVGT